MRFWESSALVALIVEQSGTSRVRGLHSGDADLVAWMLSDIEVRSAIERLRRDGLLTAEEAHSDIIEAGALWKQIRRVDLVDAVKLRAKRLLAAHPLRAADAIQLGAALVAASDDPQRIEFVTLDERLAEAARREGFGVVP